MNNIKTHYHSFLETIGEEKKALKIFLTLYYVSPTLVIQKPKGLFLLAARFVDKVKKDRCGVLIHEDSSGLWLRVYEERGVYELRALSTANKDYTFTY